MKTKEEAKEHEHLQQRSEKEGRGRYISFLEKKLKLPVSWAQNGITLEKKMAYKEALEEAMEG